jgi:hypothetical protein
VRIPRPRDRPSFLFGLTFVVLGAIGLIGGNSVAGLSWLFVIGGGARAVLSFFVRWPEPGAGAAGPGPLRSTPAGRFRATGWPPSKNPEDYR